MVARPYPFSFQEWIEADLGEIKWLVKDFIPLGAGGVFGAPTKSFKSFLILQLLLDLAEGKKVWGVFDEAPPVTTLLFQGEGATQNWQGRQAAQYEYFHRDLKAPFFVEHSFSIRGEKKAGQNYIESIVADLRPAIVAFDPLSSFFQGSDSDDVAVQNWKNFWNKLRFDYNTSPTLIHHSRQPHMGFFKGKWVEADQGMSEWRGSSQIPQWADFGGSLKRQGRKMAFVPHKARDDREGEPILFTFKAVGSSGVLVPDEDMGIGRVVRGVLQREGGMERKELVSVLAEETGKSESTVQRHLAALIRDEVLMVRVEGRRTIVEVG